MINPSKRAAPPRAFKKILKLLAAGLGLLFLVIIGLVLWLRSDSGAGFVYRQLTSILHDNGYELAAAEFKGPLPGRLLVREAVFSDHQGPIARVELLEVQVRLRDLINGLLNVPLAVIESPQLLRLPDMVPRPEEEPDSGSFSLPFALRVGTLAIKGGQVHPGALRNLNIDNPHLNFKADGSAALEKQAAGLYLTAEVAEDDGHKLLAALIQLEPKENKDADRLSLNLKIQDRPAGLLSHIFSGPDWSGLNLDLEGQGELTDWRGRLKATAGSFGDLESDFHFQGRSGRLLTDLVELPEWNLDLAASATAGSALPENLVPLLGSNFYLTAEGRRKGANLDVSLDFSEAGFSPPLTLNSSLTGVLKKKGGSFRLGADLSGLKLTPLAAPGLNFKLTAGLDLDDTRQKLTGFQLNGEGLNLEAAAARTINTGALSGDFELKLEENSRLVSDGLGLAGLIADEWGGALHLSGELDWQGLSEAAAGRLLASGRNFRWPTESLTRLLGPALDLDLNLSGGGGQAYKLEITKAQAGELSLQGTAGYRVQDNPAENELEAGLRGSLKNLGALLPGLPGPVDLELSSRGRLSDLEANLKISSPQLNPEPGPLTGLEILADLNGRVLAEKDGQPALDLSGQLNFTVKGSPGGPLALAAAWQYSQNGLETLLNIRDLKGDLAGLDLSGQLKADLGAGTDSLTGGLKADISDWSKLSALTGLAFSGSPAHLSVELGNETGPQQARAELDLPALKISSSQESLADLKNAALRFTADDLFGEPDLNLDLTLGSGLAGPAAWGPGSIKISGQKGRGVFNGQIKQLKLSGAGGQNRDGLIFNGDYLLAEGKQEINLARLDLNLGPNGLALKEPLKVGLNPNLTVSPFSAVIKPQGSLAAEADLTAGAIKIKADIKNLPYSFIRTFAGPAVPDGQIQSLTVNLAQGPSGFSGELALKTQVAMKELKNLKPSIDLSGLLSDGSSPALNLKAAIIGGPGWSAKGSLEAVIPLTNDSEGGFPQPNLTAPFSAHLKFLGPVGPIWNILDQADRRLTGQLLLEAEAGGSLAQPVPKGSAWLDKGRFEDDMYGFLISDISLEAHGTPELPLKALLAAKDGRNGALALEAELRDLNNPSLKAKGRMSRFSPIHRDDLIVFISGSFGAEGPVKALNVSSDLTMDRGEMDLKVVSLANSIPTLPISGPEEQLPATAIAGLPFDLKIKVPNQFFIRGYGLESEWRGDLTIGGDSLRPSIVGALSPVRGYFEFYAKEFQFSGGDISFNGGTTPNLNLELTYSGPTVVAVIKALGTPNRPQISLESRPSLPRDEILSQVLFGKSASQISRFEAIQLASAVKDLTHIGSGGGLNALSTIRSTLGLDVLRLGGSENDRDRKASELSGSLGQEAHRSSSNQAQSDDFAVEAGKYISDDVYVGVEHSGVSGAAVRVEIELRPNVSVEARTSQESSRVGIGWKKDY